MMILLSVILMLIALLHMLWGGGVWVPIRDEEALAKATVGAKGVTRMPGPIPCFLVALALIVVVGAIWLPDGLIRAIILWGAAAVFIGRGALAFTKFWRRMTPEEPFASNDRRFYGPLCLALGVGILFLVLRGA